MLRRQTETFGDNQYSKVTLNALSSSGTASNTMVPVRLAAGTDESCYLGAMFHMTSSTEARYEIFEVTDLFGFTSHTSGGSRGDTWSAGDYGVMEASGTSLELYTKEGAGSETSRLTWTDGTITSGKPGCGAYETSGNTVQITSWEGGDDVSPGQKTRPNADETDGGWYSNTGTQTDLYSFIDETSASDADFIEAISTTGQWTMSPVTSVGTGIYVLRYRAAGDASSNLIAYIGVGTPVGTFSAVQSFTEVGVPTAVTAFAHTVTGTFSDTTKLSVKFEAT